MSSGLRMPPGRARPRFSFGTSGVVPQHGLLQVPKGLMVIPEGVAARAVVLDVWLPARGFGA